MPTIRAVFFDIDDTLFSTTEFATLARRNAVDAMRKIGVNLTREQLLKELYEVISEFSSNYEHHFDKLLLRIPRRSFDGVNPAIIVSSAIIAYHQTKFKQLKPYRDAKQCLQALAKTDVTRGIISAGLEVKQAEKLLRLRLYKYLTPAAIFISDQIGISKPNPKLFQRACYEIGVAPAETIYVGNSLINDIEPANSTGMVTVYLKRRKKEEDTRGRRIKPNYELKNLMELISILKRDFTLEGLN
jgi:putative hydrolase of the HAD superfamily